MATLKYANKDVDPGQNFDKPFPAGLYNMEVESVELTTSKRSGEPMLAITLFVRDGEHKGRKVWEYIVQSESSAFRMRQFTDALGVKPDGAILYNEDTKLVSKIDGKKVDGAKFKANIKVEPGDDDYGPSNKVKNFIKKGEDAEEESPEEEEEETASEEEEEETASGGEEEYTWDDLSGMDRDELKEFKKEQEADTKITKKKSDDDIRRELAEEFGIDVPEEEEEEEEEESGDDGENFFEMSLAELKDKCEEYEISPKGTKKVLVTRLEKAAGGSGGKSGGGDDGDPF